MTDQAATLRVLRGGKTDSVPRARNAIAVTGGKGGIGKSLLSASLGIELAAGQVVTTGTCITPLPIAPGDRICADFGVFGEVRVVLAGADREAIADETRR